MDGGQTEWRGGKQMHWSRENEEHRLRGSSQDPDTAEETEGGRDGGGGGVTVC